MLGWLLILAGGAAAAAWVGGGGAWVRRRRYGSAAITDGARTRTRFMAVLLPPITRRSGRYAMTVEEFGRFLSGLRAEHAVLIGIDDVAEFYARGRRLPPKAVFLAFAQDNPRGLELADAELMRRCMRATAFITRTATAADGDQRRFITRHAAAQMRLGGTWDIGRLVSASSISGGAEQDGTAVLDELGVSSEPSRMWPESLRFTPSELGVNDESDNPRALHMLALRAPLAASDGLAVLRAAWPRVAPLTDRFTATGLGVDWIAGWGIIARGGGRLTLIASPRQSGAGVFLRGTEKWRDVELAFELRRARGAFWSYLRYNAAGSYVRFGVRSGGWYVEQKIGPRFLPRQIARAAMLPGALPARVRVVVKGDAMLVYVNGRMQFGHALRISPAVDQGRLLFGVYDIQRRAALAVLTSVRAAVLGEEMIASADVAGFDERRLESLREQAVFATGISPRWVHVASDGTVSAVEGQGTLIRSLGGFYGCRLVPLAEFAGPASLRAADASVAERMQAGLMQAARSLDAAGLNLRLRGGEARPETIALLKRLRDSLRQRGDELWVTLDAHRAPSAALKAAVDGVLSVSDRTWPSLTVLEAADDSDESAATDFRPARNTTARAQRESASIQ